jgi:hypothetical protein
LNSEVFPQLGLPTKATLIVRRLPFASATSSDSDTGTSSVMEPYGAEAYNCNNYNLL